MKTYFFVWATTNATIYLGDNCIHICHLGGISSDIWSEILFYGDALAEPKKLFPNVYPTIYLPK